MTSPLVTCVLAVYNGERYLREALDSVLSQTYSRVETIVVDDGSTDGTDALIRVYGDRVRHLHQSNAGPAAARNVGIARSQGTFIAFQDADDIWHPERIERQMARFEARPELALCSAYLSNFWEPEIQDEAEALRDHLIAKPFPGYGTPPSLLVRRALYDTVGPFNESLRLGSDTEWFLRASEQGVLMEVLPDVLVRRRWHRGNISRGERPTLVEVVKASLERRRRESGGGQPSPLAMPPRAAADPRP